MLCTRCNGEMKEGFVIRNKSKVKTYNCIKCDKKDEEFRLALVAKRQSITAAKNKEFGVIKDKKKRMAARRHG